MTGTFIYGIPYFPAHCCPLIFLISHTSAGKCFLFFPSIEESFFNEHSLLFQVLGAGVVHTSSESHCLLAYWDTTDRDTFVICTGTHAILSIVSVCGPRGP